MYVIIFRYVDFEYLIYKYFTEKERTGTFPHEQPWNLNNWRPLLP